MNVVNCTNGQSPEAGIHAASHFDAEEQRQCLEPSHAAVTGPNFGPSGSVIRCNLRLKKPS